MVDVPDHMHRCIIILLLIHTHHKHGGISRGGGDDDLPGPTLDVSAGLLRGSEDTSGLHNILSTCL